MRLVLLLAEVNRPAFGHPRPTRQRDGRSLTVPSPPDPAATVHLVEAGGTTALSRFTVSGRQLIALGFVGSLGSRKSGYFVSIDCLPFKFGKCALRPRLQETHHEYRG